MYGIHYIVLQWNYHTVPWTSAPCHTSFYSFLVNLIPVSAHMIRQMFSYAAASMVFCLEETWSRWKKWHLSDRKLTVLKSLGGLPVDYYQLYYSLVYHSHLCRADRSSGIPSQLGSVLERTDVSCQIFRMILVLDTILLLNSPLLLLVKREQNKILPDFQEGSTTL